MSRRQKRRKEARRVNAIPLLGAEDARRMRAAGRLAAMLLDAVEPVVRPGVSTAEIDDFVAQMTRAHGATSAPYGYHGFPAHCCTSINEVVCHGIPDAERILRQGDIVNVDVTPIVDGFHGDASRTFFVGEVSGIARRLVEDTYTALWRGIAAVRPGNHIGDIGHAIQSYIAPRGYSIVRQFSGHGIGRIFHTAPAVMHAAAAGSGEAMEPGMAFTIEPMINLGDWRCNVLDDGWTAVTVDAALSAQFEHTVLVTEKGVEVLTVGAAEFARWHDLDKSVHLSGARPERMDEALHDGTTG